MTDNKTRHTFTAAQKAQAVRQHLLGKIPVSDLAEQLGTQPRQIHLWIEQVLAQAEKAFQHGAAATAKRAENAKDLKIAQLEAKLTKKNEVVAELMEAHVQLKKEHWHIDVSYINVAGTFYFLCTLLDGYSRYIVHSELRETMKEHEVETVVQRALEKFPGETPRIISDNGPQFIARDFKEYIRLMGMTHVRTSPFYPQSNGKLERWHGSLKRECIRPACPEDV